MSDAATQRALDELATAIQKLQSARLRDVRTVDLIVGLNKIGHGLGRPASGFTVVPTVADATYAAALDSSNPRPSLEVWITVVGVAQPGARVEVW